jgi:hypothetical protein
MTEICVGAWGLGPFDNDTAGDWGYELDEAIPSERPAVLRKALATAADETGYLDYTEAAQAIAAAAIVAAHQPDGPTLDPVYSPDCLHTDGPVDVPPDLVSLALRALDREWPRTLTGASYGRKQTDSTTSSQPLRPSALHSNVTETLRWEERSAVGDNRTHPCARTPRFSALFCRDQGAT